MKKNITKPTIKQKRALKAMAENGGVISKAMITAGYSPQTAKTPSKLTNTEGWQQLLEQFLPDNKILNKVDEGMEANRVISAINTNKQATGNTTDFIEVPDHAVRHKFIETALKLKNRLNPQNDPTLPGAQAVNIQINNYGYNDPLQVLAGKVKPASDPRFISSSEVPGSQLAPEGPKDNTSLKQPA